LSINPTLQMFQNFSAVLMLLYNSLDCSIFVLALV